MAADGVQRSAAAEAKRSVPFHSAAAKVESSVSFHGAVGRFGQRGQACKSHLAIDEPEVECGVMGDDKLMGCQEAPHLRGMACERILQAQSSIREAMNPCGATTISHTRIEYEVDISQIARVFHEVAADHADTAKGYDPVVFPQAGGLDIAKRHRLGR